MSTIVSSADNTLILYACLKGVNEGDHTLNVPDLNKLARVTECITEDEINFKLHSNHLDYSSKEIKFKYHLFDDNFLSSPPIKVDKIKNFTTDFSFDLSKDEFNKIIKGSTFTTDTNKLYFLKDGNDLCVELTDKARHNTDSFTFKVGSNIQGELTKQLPINFDNFVLINNIVDKVKVSINTTFSVLLFDVEIDDLYCRYIISSLTQ